MRHFLIFCLFFASASGLCQGLPEDEKFIASLGARQAAPEIILSSRSAVLFSTDFTDKELEHIQNGFQQIGIDATFYIESESALAGKEFVALYSRYFVRRDIKVLILIRKENSEFHFYFVPFQASNWTGANQAAWHVHAPTLKALLQSVFYGVNSNQKKQNFLINDFPERKGPSNTIIAGRDEGWAPNVKFFKVAIPKTGDPVADAQLEAYLKDHFSAKYELVDASVEERDLIQKEFKYVLRFIHVPGSMAKEMLGYDMSKSESALASVTYAKGSLQLKTIPSETRVYKYFFKQLEDNIYYLGTKWDADVTWQDALQNHLDSYRAAGRIN